MVDIDFSSLKDFLFNGPDDLNVIEQWYQRLLQFEPNESETAENYELLIKALKWLMKYEYTSAQEIKDLAVKEATNAADVEEQLRKENNTLLDKINDLRQRLNSTNETAEFGETLHAENDSLREENMYLKNQIREKERDLMVQQDKVEEYRLRYEQLEKERIELIAKQTQMENNVEELKRHLESKAEATVKTEAETRKLKRRSEQAAKLSVQLQEIARQNDTLTDEVERLSTALASATQFIEETTVKYQNIQEELTEKNKLTEKLIAENTAMNKQLDEDKVIIEKYRSTEQQSSKHFKEIVDQKNIQIEEFRKKLRELQEEIDVKCAQYEFENTEAKEEELERLKTELIAATNQARQLFGGYLNMQNDSELKAQTEIVNLNKQIEILESKLQERTDETIELLRSNERKDAENAKIAAELKQLRKRTFGSAECEIVRLEKQIKFRDEQIEKLTAKCSLLQVDFETLFQSYKESETVSEESKIRETDEQQQQEDQEIATEQPKPVYRRSTGTVTDIIGNCSTSSEAQNEHKNVDINSFEANSMLIAALNNELMQVLQELNDKEKQTQRITELLERSAKETAQLKQKLKNIPQLKSGKVNSCDQEHMDKIVEMETAIAEYKKFMDAIREDGTDLERHYEATHRNLIAEKITHSQLERKIQVLERLRDEDRREYEKLRRRCLDIEEFSNKQQLQTRYESDLMTIEIARLQNIILHSVPQAEYKKLANTLKQMLKKTVIPDSESFQVIKVEEDNTLGLKLLMNPADNEPSKEELQAKNEYLENVIAMSTNQNEYWQQQCEMVQRENAEMKKLLEDLESESQLTSLVASMERRFIDELKEERMQKYVKMPNMALYISKNDYEKQRRRWNNDRKSLIAIIRKLKTKLQVDTTNKWEGITLQEMIELQKKMEQIDEMEQCKKNSLDQIMEKKDEIEKELARIQTERLSFMEITTNNGDMIKIQKSLQAAFLNVATLNSEVAKGQKLIDDLKRQNQCLSAQVSELLMESSLVADIEALILKEHEPEEVTPAKPSVSDGCTEQAKPADNTKGSNNGSSSISKLQIQYPTGTKTVVYDNWDECQKQIKRIKDTAEICIQNYKVQLNNKEKAIERYKELLESYEERTSNPVMNTINMESIKDENKRKFRKSNEILDSDELQKLKCELMRAKIRNEELEKLNEQILEDASREVQQKPQCSDSSMQTEAFGLESTKNQMDESNGTKKASSQNTDDVENTYVESDSRSDDKDSQWLTEKAENTEKFLEFNRERAENAFLKTQNRHLQQRIRELSYKNKELERLCEELRDDTVASIERKFNPTDEDSNKYVIVRLTEQIEELKQKLSKQAKTIKQQRETIESNEDKSKTISSRASEEDVARWSEKKSLQKSILNLKKRTASLVDSNNELQKKLEKYENLNNTLQKECENYSRSQKILQAVGEQLKEEINRVESTNILLENKLTDAEAAISILTKRLKSLEEKDSVTLNATDTTITPDFETAAKHRAQKQSDRLVAQIQAMDANYIALMNDYLKLKEKYEARLSDNEDYAVIAILSDKLKYKEKVIEQQQKTIAILEEEKWRQKY